MPLLRLFNRLDPIAPRKATLRKYTAHVVARIEACPIGRDPFHHLFIEEIFPPELYEKLRRRMLERKHGGKLQDRRQDSAEFVNRRYSLVGSRDPEIRYVRAIFSSPEVKDALLRKFYLEPSRELEESLKIHSEFEFVHCAPDRFQNIHLDISPKFMSFVFYIPEREVDPLAEERNATVLYGRELQPHYHAKYRANSVCVFVPHFHSYHGFASTIERDVLVMFYINESELRAWGQARRKDEPPYTALKDAVQAKLRAHPLIEYGRDETRLARERDRCLVNAPRGRIMIDADGRPLPAGRPADSAPGAAE